MKRCCRDSLRIAPEFLLSFFLTVAYTELYGEAYCSHILTLIWKFRYPRVGPEYVIFSDEFDTAKEDESVTV